ncbi:unnamed protein product [Aphanomyces euteiches]|uniref:Uncharacterized protein n=1 Tax=Aphanomyces euteiches TaxID=100861 RepID=A0A6G0WVZ9_9STRA|nr:hypothetical protein Ae201684_011012 [Aphanomyces euteiches]KAH9058596.1 hypothetical protein Ae201684P_005939 [Aphanomyces euteiches]KAH9094817.1 hypothetical protein LEN26_018071 [Aphanomyces euteiches]KAH9127688.1 hypothetical protein AeMF1_002049 [Aphanomyces euteiches]KAH9145685.1 hypothetical protein AeRB84_010396 [Aphanomyces euteiches]
MYFLLRPPLQILPALAFKMDSVMEYGHAFEQFSMEGEGESVHMMLFNYEAAECLDLCSDSEDFVYAATLASMHDKEQIKHMTHTHMYSSL